MTATVINLANGITNLIQQAVDAEDFGAGIPFHVKRVAFIKQWKFNDDTGLIRIRVATHGTEGANEQARITYGVNYVVPVAILRACKPTEMDGESIDADENELLAVTDALTEIVELIAQLVARRDNCFPGGSGSPRFVRWTHRDRSNPDGMIFNPAGLKERRQFESVIFLHYAAEFSTT